MCVNCPILWVSKLQMEVALSTTKAEYIALSQVLQDLIPFMTVIEDVSKILRIEYNVLEVQICGQLWNTGVGQCKKMKAYTKA